MHKVTKNKQHIISASMLTFDLTPKITAVSILSTENHDNALQVSMD